MMPADAAAALALFATDPLGSGLVLRGAPCPARDAILAALAEAPGAIPARRVPLHIALDRLTGGVDISASLASGRMIERPGLLQGPPAVLILSMAERWDDGRTAPVAAALDAGRIGIVALDEGEGDERLTDRLVDRCAFRIELNALPDDFTPLPGLTGLAEARARLGQLGIDDDMVSALCRAAVTLGAFALRGSLLSVRYAQVAAASAGREEVTAEDAALAARLVLSPRATRLPPEAEAPPETESEPDPPDAESAPQDWPPDGPPDGPPQPPPESDGSDDAHSPSALDDLVLEATRVALPANLLTMTQFGPRRAAHSTGRFGAVGAARSAGRPVGSRAGMPRDGLRLDLIGTLRAAAPWQRLRGRTEPEQRLRVTTGDVRVLRCKPRTATTTIFAVDASGSQALARLAEAKGAIELLLADCYVRRDSVALVSFRGPQAELLLPPTRAPARARRCLAGLAGGGGTPLASGILAATAVADLAARRGETPTIVLLTDGQANIGRDGTPGRAAAQVDALAAARAVQQMGHRCLLIDTATRRQPLAQALAEAMSARYVALPRADATSLSDAVRAARQ